MPKLRTHLNKPTAKERRGLMDGFLEAFEAVATVSGAAKQVGIDRSTHYGWLAQYPKYAQRFARSDEVAVQRLEQEARRRALVGVKEDIYYQGEVCGHVSKYSDVLLIFLLKARRPEVYRERFEARIDVKGAVRHEHVHKLSTELLRQMQRELTE